MSSDPVGLRNSYPRAGNGFGAYTAANPNDWRVFGGARVASGEPKVTNLDKVMNPLVIAVALVAYFAFRFHRLAWFAAKLHIAPKSWNRWIFGRDYDQKPR